MAQDILRSIVGRLLGLDSNGDLVLAGSRIYYGHATNTDGVVDLPSISGGGSGTLYNSSVSATLAASQNDYSPSGYLGGTTNRLLLTAASGGSTITGLNATGVPDGWPLLIVNQSTTDPISFAHLSGSSASGNKFSCANGSSALLSPLAAAFAIKVSTVWKFA